MPVSDSWLIEMVNNSGKHYAVATIQEVVDALKVAATTASENVKSESNEPAFISFAFVKPIAPPEED